MKKFLDFLIILCLVLVPMVLAQRCFATVTDADEYEDLIEQMYGFTPDEQVDINTYDELKKTIQDVEPNSLYEEEYHRIVEEDIAEYLNTPREPVNKAKIVDIDNNGEVQEYYPSSGYEVYKLSLQTITIEVLDGKYQGKQFKMDYYLTADSYENLYIKPLKVGQKINVVLVESDDGGVTAYQTTIDASVIREKKMITLLFITALCLMMFLGVYGFKILPQLILITDLLVLVFVPELYAGRSPFWLAIITCIAYVIVEVAMKLGLNKKTLMAFLATFSVVLVITCCYHGFCQWAWMSGVTLETAAIVESYPIGGIDYYDFSLVMFLMMLTVIVSNVTCQTIRVFTENDDETATNKIHKYISGMVPIIVVIFLVLNMQKYFYLMTLKYSTQELANSEMLITDWVKCLFLVIGASFTPVVAKQAKKAFD